MGACMKKSLKNNLNYVVSIIILLVSLAITLCDALIDGFDFWTHPILNFLFLVSTLYGFFVLIKGFFTKNPWEFFIAGILLSLSLLYVLLHYTFVWLTLLILFCFIAGIALTSLAVCGNKTENIALNKNEDYKDYKTRMAEKNKQEDEEVKEEVVIKSFKD